MTTAPTTPAAPAAPPSQQRKLDAQARQALSARLKPLKQALQQAEARMAAIDTERTALEARLSAGLPPAEIAEAGRRLQTLGALEERWLELGAEIESQSA